MTFRFVDGGELRLRSEEGTRWNGGPHYSVLVESAHTPSTSHSTFSDLTNICSSTGYAHQQLNNKAFLADGSCTCDDVDYTAGGANPCVGRYEFIVEGTAGSPQAGDRLIGWKDQNPAAATDATFNGPINVPESGLIQYRVN